jgi:hypothetical protein
MSKSPTNNYCPAIITVAKSWSRSSRPKHRDTEVSWAASRASRLHLLALYHGQGRLYLQIRFKQVDA